VVCRANFNLAVVESSNQMALSVAVKPRIIPVVVKVVSSLDCLTRGCLNMKWLLKTWRWVRSGRRPEALEGRNVARERGVWDSILDVDGVSEGLGLVWGVQICSREYGMHHFGKCAVRLFGSFVLEGCTSAGYFQSIASVEDTTMESGALD